MGFRVGLKVGVKVGVLVGVGLGDVCLTRAMGARMHVTKTPNDARKAITFQSPPEHSIAGSARR